jgi:long-chain acyl-CoA synthetase
LTHTVPIEPQHGARSSLAFGAAILRRGDGLVWFPEGGLSPDGRVQPFKPGLGLLLSQFRIPVVPVLIQGTFEAMPAGSRWPRSHQVNVTYGHATDVDELKQQGGSDDPERIMDALRMHVEELRGKHKAHHA